MKEFLSMIPETGKRGAALFLSAISRFIIQDEYGKAGGDIQVKEEAAIDIPAADLAKGSQAYINAISSAIAGYERDRTNEKSYIKLRNRSESVIIEYRFPRNASYISSGENGNFIFNNYVDDNGVTINGMLDFYLVFNNVADEYTYVFSGSIIFGGAVSYSVEYNYAYNYTGESDIYQGYRKINNKYHSFKPDGSLDGTSAITRENFDRCDESRGIKYQTA